MKSYNSLAMSRTQPVASRSALPPEPDLRPISASRVRRERRRFPVGERPTRRQLPPEAIGAGMEATKCLKPPNSRHDIRWRCECAGRNASERRAIPEKEDAQADLEADPGKAETAGRAELRRRPAAALGQWRQHVHKESARNTGSLNTWSGMANRTPARDRPAL